jgi:hypothetical protein
MAHQAKGTSLVEVLLAMSVASILAMMMFQLFHQNERVIRDQTLIMEMQQTARIVASQIAEEIRMAGQGVPVYAAGFDPLPSEATVVFLASSNSTRIDFRGGLSNVETAGALTGPSDFTLGLSRSVTVTSAAGFSAGRFAYLSAPDTGSSWTWLRADITSLMSTTMTVTPRDTKSPETAIHFNGPPTIALEEAVSISFVNGSVRRATATDTTDPASPVWSPANEIGRHCKSLLFTYYDLAGNVLQPTSLANRMAIARVDVELTVEVASALSDGTRPAYSLAVRSIPRNVYGGGPHAR